MEEITIIYTYYGQKERIRGILNEKHPKSRVVIVDDCSKKSLEALDGIDVYRILDNITWNQPGARNLGFQESDGWIVCADIDHLVTKKNVDDLLKIKKKKGTVYYIGRNDTRSINVYMIHKDDFMKVGGYDEDFSGNYGFDDILIYLHFKNNLNVEERRDIKVKVYAAESSSDLERDTTVNEKLLNEKKDTPKNTGKIIRFKWKKV